MKKTHQKFAVVFALGMLLAGVGLTGCGEKEPAKPTAAELEKFKGHPPTQEQFAKMRADQQAAMQKAGQPSK
jgi:hypothetical protein